MLWVGADLHEVEDGISAVGIMRMSLARTRIAMLYAGVRR